MSRRKHDPSRSLAFLFLLLCILLPHVALSQRLEACHACVPTSVRNQAAIGFDLGQSYGTSVAYLDNGTTINLAKVAGSPKYMALTERLMRTPPLESGLRRPFWRRMTRLAMLTLGLPANREIAVLAKMVADLKAETKAALGAPFGMVVVTAPWQDVWRDDGTLDSDLYDALVLAGVKPWTFDLGGGPVYMGELNTVLGASGRWLCEPYGCGDTDEDDTYQGVFFISFTNRSLYTSFQRARCFYKHSWQSLSAIDAEYGLDEMAKAATPAQFWDAVRARLASRVAEHTKHRRHGHYTITVAVEIVVVAGEAADNPDFLGVVRDVVRDIPRVHRICFDGEVGCEQGTAVKADVELVVLDDPAFAAARGSALLSRLVLEGRWYCSSAECCAESQYLKVGGPWDKTHVEL